jgi:hypothetical protein
VTVGNRARLTRSPRNWLRVRRFLGYLQDRTASSQWQLGFDETILGIQIIVARFIDHTHPAVPSSLYVRNSYVNLSSLERNLVARVVETDHETS